MQKEILMQNIKEIMMH